MDNSEARLFLHIGKVTVTEGSTIFVAAQRPGPTVNSRAPKSQAHSCSTEQWWRFGGQVLPGENTSARGTSKKISRNTALDIRKADLGKSQSQYGVIIRQGGEG